jgi:hypothetical protein
VDTNIREVVHARGRIQREEQGAAPAFNSREAGVGHTRTSPHEGDFVLTHVARREPSAVVSGLRSGVLMRVSRRAVPVLGMVVIRVRVHVPRGYLAGQRKHGQPEQNREHTSHGTSLVELGNGLKRSWLWL